MRSTWLKFIIGLMLFALTVYASQPEASNEDWDDEQYFENAYVSCLTRYESSKLSRSQVDCVCTKLANYALEWRKHQASGEPLPAASQKIYEGCFDR